MTDPSTGNGQAPENRAVQYVGIGCLMFFLGGVSGAMVAVLVSKIVAVLTKAPSCQGLPTCNWYIYAGYGALIGALSLPALVLNRLRQSARVEQKHD
jgi:hypothetical protein